MNDIGHSLELICDKNNPQDRKLLLLAKLVEEKCDELGRNQDALRNTLKDTNDKLDKLTDILHTYERSKNSCPVYQHKQTYEWLTNLISHPKETLFILIGVAAFLAGFLNTDLMGKLKIVFGL